MVHETDIQTTPMPEEIVLQSGKQVLRSWKEVAHHLKVSTRTAQGWEKRLGLPVRRIGKGQKARILADPQQLDEWLRQSRMNSSRQSANADPPEAEEITPGINLHTIPTASKNSILRFWKIASAGIAIFILSITPFLMDKPFSGTPVRIGLENRTMKVFDGNNHFLWQTQLTDLDPQDAHLNHSNLISDVDGDGSQEVLFEYLPGTDRAAQPKLLCFSSRGDLRWEYAFTSKNVESSRHFSLIHPLNRLLRVVGEKQNYILYAPIHDPSPHQVILLDAKTGRLVEEYWHPGNSNPKVSWETGIKMDSLNGLEEANDQDPGKGAVRELPHIIADIHPVTGKAN